MHVEDQASIAGAEGIRCYATRPLAQERRI